ncbi:hypothetical protein C8R44DRAFT_785410 [Mycena epipterygia]|nr:hypothetical protein C8R44DRAFT_785410 [Mycena epipterygia]
MAPAVSLDSTLGAIEIGTMISIFLFGIVTVQVFSYFRNFHKDPWQLKLLVGVIWAVELIHTALTCASTYEKTITSFGDVQALPELSTSFNLSIAFVAVIGPLVQGFYAYRILKLSGRRLMPVICWILSILRFLNLLGISISAFLSPNLIEYKIRFSWLIISSLVISATTDILITATTCYYLRTRSQNKSTFQFQRTRNMVDFLVLWSIQTGLLTSVTTILMLICFVTMDNFIWVAFLFLVSRSFSNSLLSSLNSRTSIREGGRATDFLELKSGLNSFRPAHGPDTILVEITKRQSVRVDTQAQGKAFMGEIQPDV